MMCLAALTMTFLLPCQNRCPSTIIDPRLKLQILTSIPCNARFSTSAECSISVTDCMFMSLSIVGNGAVISIDNSGSSMTINNSAFSSCYASNYGGAIYVFTPINKISYICGINCYSGKGGEFVYDESDQTCYMNILASTITKCSNSTSLGSSSTFYAYGTCLYFTNANISHCMENGISFCCFKSAKYLSLSYSNAFNCSGSALIYGYLCNSMAIDHSNVVGCRDNSGDYSLFYSFRSVTSCGASFSVFANNSSSYLFSADTKKMVISRCWISHSSICYSSGVSFTNCSFGFTASMVLFTFEQTPCYISPSPSQSPSKSPSKSPAKTPSKSPTKSPTPSIPSTKKFTMKNESIFFRFRIIRCASLLMILAEGR